jgi:ACR3 family arsenite transporter
LSCRGNTLLVSAVLIVVPLASRNSAPRVLARGPEALAPHSGGCGPSIAALLATLVLLFAFRAGSCCQPLVITLLAVPIVIQVTTIAAFTYWLDRKLGVAHCVAGPSALIGASTSSSSPSRPRSVSSASSPAWRWPPW